MKYQNTMNLNNLEEIRLSEIESLLYEIRREKPEINIILEIGARTGWQAKKLSENGDKVEAIDIADNNYGENRVWPILIYDGMHIPFPDSHFDIVFSSNVLEHIPHINAFQIEIKRVLKTDGIAIHVVPSGTWRFWTNIAHYVFIIKKIWSNVCSKTTIKIDSPICGGLGTRTPPPTKIELLRKAIFPSRHGEIGTSFSEIYNFSRRRWSVIFKRSEWDVKRCFPNKLFYTGYTIFGPKISIQFRRYLSFLFGSSCHVFLLTKGKASK